MLLLLHLRFIFTYKREKMSVVVFTHYISSYITNRQTFGHRLIDIGSCCKKWQFIKIIIILYNLTQSLPWCDDIIMSQFFVLFKWQITSLSLEPSLLHGTIKTRVVAKTVYVLLSKLMKFHLLQLLDLWYQMSFISNYFRF